MAITKKQQTKSRIWSISKADKEFSKWIRARDRKCQRCGTENNLTCSHFWARQHKGGRFNPDNCVAVCWMPCHKYYWEKEKQGDYRDYMLKRLGKKKYSELEKVCRGTYPQATAIIDCMRLLGVLPNSI
jgi:hypothetical protein